MPKTREEASLFKEDRSIVEVEGVNVQNCWLRGQQRAVEVLRCAVGGDPLFSLDEVDFAAMATERVNTFKPFGTWVGMSGAELDDEDEPIFADADPGVSFENGDDERDVEVLEELSQRKQAKVKDANGCEISLDKA